jgi:hypothetical protein
MDPHSHGARESVKGGRFHFDRMNALVSRGFDRLALRAEIRS